VARYSIGWVGWLRKRAQRGEQLVGRQRAQLLAQALGCVDHQRLEVVDRARAGPHRALSGGDQDPDGLPVAALARLGQVLVAERLASDLDRGQVVGLGAVAARRAGRTVDLDHPLALLEQVGRQAGPVAAGALDRPDPAAWCLLDGEPVNVQVAIGVGGTVRCARAAPVGVTTAAVCVAVWVSTPMM
jgi:hypothetical protein